MHSYLFYDIETSGLNKCFDQVLQFAAIRTDHEFNEIDRYEYLLRLNSDTIVHPQALITHRIALSSLDKGLCEFEAIRQIHQLMNTPGTISLGYNTMGFDDEFLRFSFYRNLLDSYSHQYANNCRRMDIYPMTVMFYLFNPPVIEWPSAQNGEGVSFKLADISDHNHLSEGPAHDAMVDVEATLALAKRLSSEEKMWHYLSDGFIKRHDQQRIEKLAVGFDHYRVGLMVGGEFGRKQNYQVPVLILGQHHYYRNQMLCLRLDLPQLRQTTADTIDETCWVIHKKLAEPGFVLPLSDHYAQGLDQSRRAEMDENLLWLQANRKLLQAIDQYYCHYRYPIIANIDASAALYQNGFWPPQAKSACWQFHRATINERAEIADHIEHPLLRKLAIRVLGRNYPQHATAAQQQSFDDYLQAVWSSEPPIDFKGHRRYSRQQCLADISELEKAQEIDSEQQLLLSSLKKHIQALPVEAALEQIID